MAGLSHAEFYRQQSDARARAAVARMPVVYGTVTAIDGIRLRIDDTWYQISRFTAIPVVVPSVGQRVKIGLDRQGYIMAVATRWCTASGDE